jgi:hypothetical protein
MDWQNVTGIQTVFKVKWMWNPQGLQGVYYPSFSEGDISQSRIVILFKESCKLISFVLITWCYGFAVPGSLDLFPKFLRGASHLLTFS